jgi:membrane-bound serine protease (ClpP class)
MLIDTDIPEYQLSWSVIGSTAAISAAFLIFVCGYAWRAHRRKVLGGPEELIGSEAIVLDWSGGEGHVMVEGERWNARGDGAFAKGERVKIRLRHGLTLVVARC